MLLSHRAFESAAAYEGLALVSRYLYCTAFFLNPYQHSKLQIAVTTTTP